MPAPRFSVVIPTRNRARTLARALRTCLDQDFEDFEVVVSDNFSTPETRRVVEECGDRRVRYVRTPADLAMTDSWEFAVGQAAGEYVTVVGDDDGLLGHGLAEADRILRLADMPALRWEPVLYNWPDVSPRGSSRPGDLLVPLRLEGAHHAVFRYDSAPRIRAAADGAISYAELPMIYCSLVRADVLRKLRRQAGRVFKGRAPDVYAAFAVAHAAGSYYATVAPLGIAGTSGHSTGLACVAGKGRTAIAADFRRGNEAAGIVAHPAVPDLPALACYTAEAFLHAREALFAHDPSLAPDRRRFTANALREVRVEGDEWRLVLSECRRALADDPALVGWFDREYGGRPAPRPDPAGQTRRRFGGTYLCLDAAEFGVADVAGAARLCEQLLGYRRDRLNPRLAEAPTGGEPLSELQEKEAVIQSLDGAVKALNVGLRAKDAAIAELRSALKQRDEYIRALEEFRGRVRRPVRLGLPHLFRKAVRRFAGGGRNAAP